MGSAPTMSTLPTPPPQERTLYLVKPESLLRWVKLAALLNLLFTDGEFSFLGVVARAK